MGHSRADSIDLRVGVEAQKTLRHQVAKQPMRRCSRQTFLAGEPRKLGASVFAGRHLPEQTQRLPERCRPVLLLRFAMFGDTHVAVPRQANRCLGNGQDLLSVCSKSLGRPPARQFFMYRYSKKQFRYSRQMSEQLGCRGRQQPCGCLLRRSVAFAGSGSSLRPRGPGPPSIRHAFPCRQVKAGRLSAMSGFGLFWAIRNRCGWFVRGEIQMAQSVRLQAGLVALPTAHARPNCRDCSLLLAAVSVKRPIDSGGSGLKEIFEFLSLDLVWLQRLNDTMAFQLRG